MPTTLPRINITLERPAYEAIHEISKTEKISMSEVVSRFVNYALELSEDLPLVEIAEKRLASFRRDDALTSKEMLRWITSRRKRG